MALVQIDALTSPRVDRQSIVCDGRPRRVVRIPDYQIKLGPAKPWHRRGAIETEAACGAEILGGAESLRSYLLDGALCRDGCFSPRELQLGEAHERAQGFDVSDARERDDITRER